MLMNPLLCIQQFCLIQASQTCQRGLAQRLIQQVLWAGVCTRAQPVGRGARGPGLAGHVGCRSEWRLGGRPSGTFKQRRDRIRLPVGKGESGGHRETPRSQMKIQRLGKYQYPGTVTFPHLGATSLHPRLERMCNGVPRGPPPPPTPVPPLPQRFLDFTLDSSRGLCSGG